MFGVGATVGTGIFFVLQQAVPEAGPAVIISFMIAGIAAGLVRHLLRGDGFGRSGFGLNLLLRLHHARRVRRDGRRRMPAARVRRLHLRGRVGWSGYLNKLLDNLFGVQIPHALTAAPWDETPGIVNLPAMMLIAMCALLLIRGASESAMVNTIMVIIKLGVLALFVVIAFTAFNTDHFAGFLDRRASPGSTRRPARSSSPTSALTPSPPPVTRSRTRRRPCRARSSRRCSSSPLSTYWWRFAGAGRAAGRGVRLEEQAEAGLSVILDNITGSTWASTVLAAGAVISIFSVTLVVMYGQTRILFAMGRDGLLPSMFAKVNPRTMTPVNNTIIVAVVVAILAGFVPLDYLLDMVSIGTLVAFIMVSIGVIILRVREPDLPRGFKVPRLSRSHTDSCRSSAACVWILYGLHWYTWLVVRRLGGRRPGVLLGLGPTPQRAERRRRRLHTNRGTR